MPRIRMNFREGVSRGLCHSCTHSHITSDVNGHEVAICQENQMVPLRIHRVIVDCNRHRQINEMTEWEAKQQGWILEVKGARVIGFKKPEED